MSQTYNGNIKRKTKENQVGILKNYAFYRKIQQKTSDAGESAIEVTYLSMIIYPKIFPLKVATTLLSSSGKGTAGA